MKNIFCTTDALQPASRALVYRTFANSATCALIGMVASTIAREQRAIKAGQDPHAEVTGITAYSDMRDEAQDDNDGSAPIGGEGKLTLNLLVEWTAATRALASTTASGLDTAQDRQFARPQEVKDSLDFMCTPRTSVTKAQIEAVREEEPEISDSDAVAIIRGMAVQDAARLTDNRALILDRINELLDDAPADREMDTIFADLPEAYRTGQLDKALGSVEKELARTLPLAIRGVPGISAKRKVLKGDLPALEELAA